MFALPKNETTDKTDNNKSRYNIAIFVYNALEAWQWDAWRHMKRFWKRQTALLLNLYLQKTRFWLEMSPLAPPSLYEFHFPEIAV